MLIFCNRILNKADQSTKSEPKRRLVRDIGPIVVSSVELAYEFMRQ